jgi:hypothetical protein
MAHDFHPLTALGLANLLATALGRGKGGIDEALRLIERPFLSEGIGQLHERIPQHFTATPLLETSVHRFVVRIALRQHVPLRTRVQNPQDGFEYPAQESVCVLGGLQEYVLPENVPGCVPTAHRSDVTCSQLYSMSLTSLILR